MARRGRRGRTRVITRTRFGTRMSGSSRGFRARHRSKVDHLSTIAAGAGMGAILSTVTQLLAKNTGFSYPIWVNPLLGAIGGFFIGKHIGHSTSKGAEGAVAGAITAYAEDRVVTGQPLFNLSLSGGQGGVMAQGVLY